MKERKEQAIDYLAQVKNNPSPFEFRQGTMDDTFIAPQEGGSLMLALLSEIYIMLQKSFRSFLLPVGSLDFLCSVFFFKKSNRCWAQLPNSGPVLNNWLMRIGTAVTGITNKSRLPWLS